MHSITLSNLLLIVVNQINLFYIFQEWEACFSTQQKLVHFVVIMEVNIFLTNSWISVEILELNENLPVFILPCSEWCCWAVLENYIWYDWSMFKHGNLPHSWWGQSALAAVYIRNRMLSSAIHPDITPYEQFFGQKPDLSNLRVFGCKVFVYNEDPQNERNWMPEHYLAILLAIHQKLKEWEFGYLWI